MAVSITRFTRFGVNLGKLHVYAAVHAEDLDGTDELTITCREDLAKGDYLVWRDAQGHWREHIVDVPERTHAEDGTTYTKALAINSIAETWDDWIGDIRPSGSVQMALSSVLAPSRWAAGQCTQTGTASKTFYHESVREALSELVETWGGEMATAIQCDGTKVTGRTVAVVTARGNQSSAKRFTWTKDLLTIARRVNSDNPKTRIYAYGKGEEVGEGYGRRIGIESVNGGVPYVEDTAATAIWGKRDASGNLMPAVGVYLDQDCEDPGELMQGALAYLASAKEPSVTYTADVIDLAAFGRAWEDVALGDTVTIVDKGFSGDGLRLRGRISKLERDLLGGETKVTFGTLVNVLAGSWAGMTSQVGTLAEKTSSVEQIITPSASWLDQLMASINAQFNSSGTYRYSSFEQGDIWASVPLDENGHATQAGGWAMGINGHGFRLASSLNADGSWNWRSFGTGEGFTADEIVAGIIRGGNSYWNLNTGDLLLNGGRIASTDGLNWWDLGTGELHVENRNSAISIVEDVAQAVEQAEASTRHADPLRAASSATDGSAYACINESLIGWVADGYKTITTGDALDTTRPLLWASANASPSALFSTAYSELASQSLRANAGASWTGYAGATAYIFGTLSGGLLTVAGFTSAVPTSENTYVYIPLGLLYSDYQITFKSSSELWAFLDGEFQQVKLGSLRKAVSLEQTAESFAVQFETVGVIIGDVQDDLSTKASISDVDDLDDRTVKTTDARLSWMRVQDEGGTPSLVLGTSASSFHSKLTNSKMGFYDGGAELASLSGVDGLAAPRATVSAELRIGNWALIPQSDSSLSLKYIGG